MKTTLLNIFKRITKYDKGIGIITNGEDNLYSERAERIILNSVTAKTSANIMASYISGKGLGETNNVVKVNKKGLTALKFSQIIAKNFSKQRGVWIHVNYNANFEPSQYTVLPYTHCRLGKKDDNDYNGKILVSKEWETTKKLSEFKKDLIVIDVYNRDKKVIAKQIEKAGSIENYKGQILYYNLDEEYDYALSQIDSVMNDCDSEAQSSVYKNRSLRRGFFGKTLIITKPLAGALNDYETPELYAEALSERKAFKSTIDDFIGAENNGGALHVELEHDGDKFEDGIKIENISSDINDKLFEYTESSTFKNILMAFNNIPTGLVRSDNALFSSSGEALQIMKETYQENTMLERDSLEQLLNELLIGFNGITDVTIEPLIEIKEEEKNTQTDDVPNN